MNSQSIVAIAEFLFLPRCVARTSARHALNRAGDSVELGADVGAEQGEGRDADNGDQRQDQAVLGQPLALFALGAIAGTQQLDEQAIDNGHLCSLLVVRACGWLWSGCGDAR